MAPGAIATTELFDKPNPYFNLEKLRRAVGLDRRLGLRDFKAVCPVWPTRIPEYIKDYVPVNQFM